MSHKEAPPLTDEQRAFESCLQASQENVGVHITFGRGKDGNYLSEYARICFRLWQKAVMWEQSKNDYGR
jgi:hypothetical protein